MIDAYYNKRADNNIVRTLRVFYQYRFAVSRIFTFHTRNIYVYTYNLKSR